jgi:hypothetical protein
VLKDKVFRFALVLFSLILVFLILPFFTRTNLYDFYLPLLLVSIIAFQYRLKDIIHFEERRFWHLLSLAYSFWLVARLLYQLIGEDHWNSQLDLITDLLYLGYFVCLFLGISSRPHLYSGWSRQNRLFIIESIGGVAFIFGVLTYFVLIPLNLESVSEGSREPSFYMYVLLDLLLAGLEAILGREEEKIKFEGQSQSVLSWESQCLAPQ